MAVPNVLGFLQESLEERKMPSPLTQFVNNAVGTYTDVQKAKQATSESTIKALDAQAAPQDIATRQQKETAVASQETSKAQYLPDELESEQKKRQLLLDALPKDIDLRQSHEGLENLHQSFVNTTDKMSIDQLHQQLVDAEMTKLHDVHLNNPELEPDQIAASKKTLSTYGVDPNVIPDKPDTNFWGMAGLSAKRSPEAQAYQKYQQDLTKTALEGQLKIRAEDAKQGNVLQQTLDKKTGEITGDWIQTDLPKTVEAANRIDDNMDDILKAQSEHGFLMSPVGKLLGGNIWKGSVNYAKSQALNTVLEQLASTPGASRGTKALLNTLKDAKIDVFDPPDAIRAKAAKLKTVSALVREEQRFANTMMSYGINNKAQIEESWDKFLESKTYKTQKGGYDPSGAKNWTDYFAKHAEDLPTGLVRSMQEQVQVQQADQKGVNLPLGAKQTARLDNLFGGTQQQYSQQDMDRMQNIATQKAAAPGVNVALNTGVIPRGNTSYDQGLTETLTSE